MVDAETTVSPGIKLKCSQICQIRFKVDLVDISSLNKLHETPTNSKLRNLFNSNNKDAKIALERSKLRSKVERSSFKS